MEASTGELPQIETAGAQKDAPRAADVQDRRLYSSYFLHSNTIKVFVIHFHHYLKKKKKLARLHLRKTRSSNFTPLNNMALEYPLLLSKSKKMGNCPAVFCYYTQKNDVLHNENCLFKRWRVCRQNLFYPVFQSFMAVASVPTVVNKLPQCYVEGRVRLS